MSARSASAAKGEHERAFGTRLAQERKRRGWSQAYLAERMGINEHTVLRLEAGTTRVDLDRVASAAEALDCGVGVLLRSLFPAEAADDADAAIVAELQKVVESEVAAYADLMSAGEVLGLMADLGTIGRRDPKELQFLMGLIGSRVRDTDPARARVQSLMRAKADEQARERRRKESK